MSRTYGNWGLEEECHILNSALGSALIYLGLASGMNTLIVKDVKEKIISGSGTQYSRGGLEEEKQYTEKLIKESYGRRN